MRTDQPARNWISSVSHIARISQRISCFASDGGETGCQQFRPQTLLRSMLVKGGWREHLADAQDLKLVSVFAH